MGGGKQYRVRRAECEEKPSDTVRPFDRLRAGG